MRRGRGRHSNNLFEKLLVGFVPEHAVQHARHYDTPCRYRQVESAKPRRSVKDFAAMDNKPAVSESAFLELLRDAAFRLERTLELVRSLSPSSSGDKDQDSRATEP